MNRLGMATKGIAALLLLALLSLCAQQPDPHSIPVVDGALGPCSADFTINDTAGKPVYAARIKVRDLLRVPRRPQARSRSRHQRRRQSPVHRHPQQPQAWTFFRGLRIRPHRQRFRRPLPQMQCAIHRHPPQAGSMISRTGCPMSRRFCGHGNSPRESPKVTPVRLLAVA